MYTSRLVGIDEEVRARFCATDISSKRLQPGDAQCSDSRFCSLSLSDSILLIRGRLSRASATNPEERGVENGRSSLVGRISPEGDVE